MKLEHILIPIDFSDNSRLALSYAAAIREKFPARITLLHVLEPFVGYGPSISIMPVTLDVEREEGAMARLKELAATFDKLVPVGTVCLRGKPWREICEWAKENTVDLIVIPTHGYSGLMHAWLGSVAEHVVRKASCPVLTVRGGE